ncbi:MAG: hypothetical protein WBB22_06565 [Anaerolineae bacterium]
MVEPDLGELSYPCPNPKSHADTIEIYPAVLAILFQAARLGRRA